jgi:hypothetical protein
VISFHYDVGELPDYAAARRNGKTMALVMRLGRLDRDLVLVTRPSALADLMVDQLPGRDIRVSTHRDVPRGVVLAYRADAVPDWAGPPAVR